MNGMSPSAIEKAAIVETLNGSIPVKKIAEQLGISKTTLYLYLRYRNVLIGEKLEKERM
jgi:phage antirepressor YoqD-like protein